MNVNYLEVGDELEVHGDLTVWVRELDYSRGYQIDSCTIIYTDHDYILALYGSETHILLRYNLPENDE